MEAVLDFNKYYLPEQVKGFELFIGPDGEYYKVKNIKNNSNYTHYEWAEQYIKSFTNDVAKTNCFDSLNLLIHKYGFVRYTHRFYSPNPILDIPNPSYYGVSITKEQINSIYSLLDCNLEYITEEQKNMFDYNYNVYSNASDAVYTRHISKKG